jgi:hypothetical protein
LDTTGRTTAKAQEYLTASKITAGTGNVFHAPSPQLHTLAILLAPHHVKTARQQRNPVVVLVFGVTCTHIVHGNHFNLTRKQYTNEAPA